MKERTTKTWRNKLDTNHQTKNIYSYSELWSSPMMSRVRYWWGNSPKGCQLIVAHNSKQNLWPGLHRPAFHEQHLSKSLWLPNWSRLCWSRMPLLFRDAALLLVLLGCCPASAADDCDLPLKVERHDLHQVGIRWRLDTEKEQPCFLRRSFVLFFHAGEGSLFHFFFFFAVSPHSCQMFVGFWWRPSLTTLQARIYSGVPAAPRWRWSTTATTEPSSSLRLSEREFRKKKVRLKSGSAFN